VRYNYVAGAMAGGIGSVDIVVAMARAGMMGFFGSGGVGLQGTEEAIHAIRQQLADLPAAPFGMNLLHSPFEPELEERTVDLYLQSDIPTIEASAYLRLTPSVVRFRAHGMRRDASGRIEPRHRVFAKVSSLDVAEQFMSPPPEEMLRNLVAAGQLLPEEAELAALVPVAEDVTAEADSGGHTDGRPLTVLLPQMIRRRDEIAVRHGYARSGITVRVGAGGTIGDPVSVRAALAMGADYILTGSINQTSLQADTSVLAKEMLAAADMRDVTMAPAADMFEMGVQVQVLKRGTLYAQRARKLYELYRTCDGLENIPTPERLRLEQDIFRRPLEEVWETTARYWETRDRSQLDRAARDPKYRMALVFRWYLGMSSRWAKMGEAERKSDFQIWCGPSMGLFNRWVAGTWLEPVATRDVALMGLALLRSAAVLLRAEQLAQQGIRLPALSALAEPPAPAVLRRALAPVPALGATG
jgi:PfaD family protein